MGSRPVRRTEPQAAQPPERAAAQLTARPAADLAPGPLAGRAETTDHSRRIRMRQWSTHS